MQFIFIATWASPTLFFADENLINEKPIERLLIIFFQIMITHIENCGLCDVFTFTAATVSVSVPLQRLIQLFGTPAKEYYCIKAEFKNDQDYGYIFVTLVPQNRDASLWDICAHTKKSAEMMAEYINSVK